MCSFDDILNSLKGAGISPDKAEALANSMKDNVKKAVEKNSKEIGKKTASKLLALTQNFKKENNKIASLDKVTGAVAPKRVSPLPLNSAGTNTEAHHPDLNSSADEDYPNTIMEIDEVGNWKKINKKTGQTDFVHNSGSKISFYKNGDVVFHVLGNMKFFVEGDLLQEVGNRMELTTGENFIQTIKGSKEENISISRTITAPVETKIIPVKLLLGAMETKNANLVRNGQVTNNGDENINGNVTINGTLSID